jgi:hypothetical protein
MFVNRVTFAILHDVTICDVHLVLSFWLVLSLAVPSTDRLGAVNRVCDAVSVVPVSLVSMLNPTKCMVFFIESLEVQIQVCLVLYIDWKTSCNSVDVFVVTSTSSLV